VKRWMAVALAALVLTGCNSQTRMAKQVQAPDPNQQQLQAAGFQLTLTTPGPGTIERLRLYMDGPYAANRGLSWQLARQDRGSIYAAFPCAPQSVAEDGTVHCSGRYRSEQSYATEQAEALAQMLSTLKQQRGARTLDVIASAGAAPLMLKVAAIGGDIDHLHTLDGTLSPAIWARETGQQVPATSDPLIFYRQLARQSQTHWISAGSGPEQEKLAGLYKQALKQSPCVRLRIASTVIREGDWQTVWPVLKDNRFSCRSR